MDWGSITTLVAEVLFGGGLLVFVTIKDKKTAAILDNMQRVIEEERALAADYLVIRYATPRINSDNSVTYSIYELKFSAIEYTTKAIHKTLA